MTSGSENSWTAKLRCPACRNASLSDVAGSKTWKCSSCGHEMPVLQSIPWVYEDPEAHIHNWRGNLRLNLQKLAHDTEQLKVEANADHARELTRKRLARHLQATLDHKKSLEKLLAPMNVDDTGEIDISRAFRHKMPISQSITSYYSNIHRDWDFGDEEGSNENAISLDLVLDNLKVAGIEGAALPKDDAGKMSLLALGPGACRLPYDLHRSLSFDETVAIDINPLLMLAAQKILSGKSLKLYEFPIAPLDEAFVQRQLKAPEAAENFHIVAGDAMDPPVVDGAYSMLLTPWLIDIVAQDPAQMFPRFNRTLAMGGVWVNFGSLFFDKAQFGAQLSREEVNEIVAAAGFEMLASEDRKIPYMQSPASRHGRVETAYTFVAKKVREVNQPDAYRYLPSWLVEDNQPLPQQQNFVVYTMQHRLYSEIIGLIDGKRTKADLVAFVVERYKMTPDDARSSVTKFLTTVYEGGRL